MVYDKDRIAIREFKKKVKKIFGSRIVELRLFGSKSRGEDTEFSDIDILIVIKNLTKKEEEMIREIDADIGLEEGVVLSSIIYDEERYKACIELPFLTTVKKEGVVL